MCLVTSYVIQLAINHTRKAHATERFPKKSWCALLFYGPTSSLSQQRKKNRLMNSKLREKRSKIIHGYYYTLGFYPGASLKKKK